MICDLCTIDTIRGVMFRTGPQKRIRTNYSAGFVICEDCRDAVLESSGNTIDETETMQARRDGNE